MNEPAATVKPGRARFVEARRYCTERAPGLLFCLLLVSGALFLADHFGSSAILGAFLIGMAFNSISRYPEMVAGIDFCARDLLRLGVALLGVRLGFAQVAQLGIQPALVAVAVVAATLVASAVCARLLRIDPGIGWISGAAVGICGVSAALAVAAALRPEREPQVHMACIVAGVAGLSSLCMMLYPGMMLMLDWTPAQMGVFLGATIHDVAQVVGAGEMISPEVTQVAAYTKMLRVAMLFPAVVMTVIMFRRGGSASGGVTTYFPPFLLGFVLLAIMTNLRWVPASVVAVLEQLSQGCMWVAMAALGTRTNLVELWLLGRRPFVLLLINTVFLGVLAFFLVN